MMLKHRLCHHLYKISLNTRIPLQRIALRYSIRMASTFPKLPIFEAIASHDPNSTAIIHSKSDRSFTYGQLLSDVEGAKIQLYRRLKESTRDGEPIGGQRVAFLVENGYDYVGAREHSFSTPVQYSRLK